jgi:hypothetical protein
MSASRNAFDAEKLHQRIVALGARLDELREDCLEVAQNLPGNGMVDRTHSVTNLFFGLDNALADWATLCRHDRE